MRRKRIRFCTSDTEVPIIPFMFGGNIKLQYAIIDTGSEITLFDYDTAKENKDHFKVHKPKEKINIVGLHSDTNTPSLNADAEIFVNVTDPLTVKNCLLYSLNHLNGHFKISGRGLKIAAILGSNFLESIHAEINYEKKAIYYDLSGQI